MKCVWPVSVLLALLALPARADVRDDLQAALSHALEQGNRADLTEENILPQIGPATEAALLLLLQKRCVAVDARNGTNAWSVGPGCGKECRIGPFTSPLMPGNGLICRVARQAHIEVIGFTPPAPDQQGAVRSHVEYRAQIVDVAQWARDPAYAAIWNSYGLNFETFHAFADLVKSDAGWIPYE